MEAEITGSQGGGGIVRSDNMWSTSVNDIDEERDGMGDMIIDGKVGCMSAH